MLDSTAVTTYHLPRPEPSEYDPYYSRYIDLVPDGAVLHTLRQQLGNTLLLFEDLPRELETHRYAEGKWSLREVVGHLVDAERLFEFRALAMARQDGVDLPGMDQDQWAARNGAHARELSDLLEEWKTVRRSAIHMFATFDEVAGARTGRASGRSFTVRTFPWVIAGHELWHRRIIEERYLGR